MRIGLVAKSFAPAGGAQTYLRGLAADLLAGGHELHLFAAAGEPPPGARWHPVAAGGPRCLRDWRFAQAARRAAAACPLDVVAGEQKALDLDVARPGGGLHADYLKAEARAHPGAAARLAKRLALALSLKERLDARLERLLYASARLRAVIANSGLVERALLREYPGLAGRVRRIPNGVDLERFRPGGAAERAAARAGLGLPPEAPLILFAAHNFRLKGLGTLVAALPRLEPRAAALVVGRGAPGRWRRQAARLGVADRLFFAGAGDTARWLAAADVLAHPTFHDPFANVTLEALACGVPVVTTRYNGAAEVLEAGRTGFVLDDPADAGKLAAALAEAFALERSAAAGAARAAAERHPRAANSRAVLAVLQEAAAARAAAGG